MINLKINYKKLDAKSKNFKNFARRMIRAETVTLVNRAREAMPRDTGVAAWATIRAVSEARPFRFVTKIFPKKTSVRARTKRGRLVTRTPSLYWGKIVHKKNINKMLEQIYRNSVKNNIYEKMKSFWAGRPVTVAREQTLNITYRR